MRNSSTFKREAPPRASVAGVTQALESINSYNAHKPSTSGSLSKTADISRHGERLTPLQQRRERSLVVASTVGSKVERIADLVPRVVLASPYLKNKATKNNKSANDDVELIEDAADLFPSASARLRKTVDSARGNNINSNNEDQTSSCGRNTRMSNNSKVDGGQLNQSQSVLRSMPLSRTMSLRDRQEKNNNGTPTSKATTPSPTTSKKGALNTSQNNGMSSSTYTTVTATKDGTRLYTGVGYISSVVDKPVDLTHLHPSTTTAETLAGAVACDGAFHLSAKSNHWVNVHNAKEENFRLRATQKLVGLALSQQLHDTAREHATATGFSDEHQRANQKRVALMEDKMAANYEQFLINTRKREVAKHCHESRLIDARAAEWTAPIYLALTAQLMARAVQVARAREVLRRLFLSRSLAYLRRKKALAKRREQIQVHEDALVERPSNDLLRVIVPAVSHLPDALITKISEALQKRCYLASEFIAYAGEPGDTCFILARGVVECTSLTPDLIQKLQNTNNGEVSGSGSSSQAPTSSLPQTDLSEAVTTFRLANKTSSSNQSGSNSASFGVSTIQKPWSVLCRSVLLTPEEYEHTFRACPRGPGADFWVITHAKFSQLCETYFTEQTKILKGLVATAPSTDVDKHSTKGKGNLSSIANASTNADSDAPPPANAPNGNSNTNNASAAEVRQYESILAARDWYLRSIDGRRELNMIRYHTLTHPVVRKASSLFAHWSPQGLQGIIDKARPMVHRKDDVVVREGKYGKEMLLVVAGKLELLQDGKRVSVMASGSCVGDIAAAAGLRNPNTTIKALTNSAVWVVDHKDLEALVVREDPNIFMASVLASIDEHGHERMARQV